MILDILHTLTMERAATFPMTLGQIRDVLKSAIVSVAIVISWIDAQRSI